MHTDSLRIGRHLHSRIAASLCLLATLLIPLLSSYGQRTYPDSRVDLTNNRTNVIPPSPTAAAFAEYIENPVGYYTGTPQIGIPLWQVPLKDFSLPIGLSYHAGGVKVSEEASCVGLNWSLQTGGVITRAVKDKPDDQHVINCMDSWVFLPGESQPQMDDFTFCGYGLIHAKNAPANNYFDGLTSYDIDLSAYNGPYGPFNPTHSSRLLKKFYGINTFEPFGNNVLFDNLYMLPMVDKEPDIFYFNFAGYSGKFVFDVSGTVPEIVTVPHQDLTITYTLGTNQSIDAFTVVDNKGVSYTFSTRETTTQTTNSTGAPLDFGDQEASGVQFTVRSFNPGASTINAFMSAWYLSRIDTPLGEYLDFTYTDEDYVMAQRGPQQTGLYYIKSNSNRYLNYDPNPIETTDYGYHNSFGVNDTRISGKRIATIENDELRVDFLATFQRDDLAFVQGQFPQTRIPPAAITDIAIYNKIGGDELIKKFVLSYDYFESSTDEPINFPVDDRLLIFRGFDLPRLNPYDMNVDEPDAYYKRLRLLSVQEFGKTPTDSKPPFFFEYKYADFTGDNAHRLPHSLSYQRDIWGYYNGALANRTLIPAVYVYPDHYSQNNIQQFRVYPKNSFSGREILLRGADRLPNASTMDIGLLTKIGYPTGGSTTYNYEPHQFIDEGETLIGGGLRITQVVKHDGTSDNPPIQSTYSYAGGSVVSKPVHAFRNAAFTYVDNDDSDRSIRTLTTRFGYSQSGLGMTNGSYVGYRTVTEANAGNGKQVFTYSMPATWHVANDIPISQGGVCDPAQDGHCDSFYELTPVVDIFVVRGTNHNNASEYDFNQNPALPNTFPFPDNPNYDWQRGHLLSTTLHREDNTIAQQKEYVYANYFPDGKTEPTKVYGYKLEHHYPLLQNGNSHPNAYVFRAAKYHFLTGVAKVLQDENTTVYDQIVGARTSTKSRTYFYESETHRNVTREVEDKSDGTQLITRLKYPSDYDSQTANPGVFPLQANGMSGIPVEVSTYIDRQNTEQLISSRLIFYELRFGKPMPHKYYDLFTSEPISDFIASSIVNNELSQDARYEESIDFTEHDEHGNLLEFKARDGVITTHLWGYNHNFPVAQIQGLSYSEVTAAVDPASLQALDEQALLDALNPLRDLSDALVTTYTYDPLIGPTSQTAPNRLTLQYHYDNLNRLRWIENHEGAVQQKFAYHYGQESDINPPTPPVDPDPDPLCTTPLTVAIQGGTKATIDDWTTYQANVSGCGPFTYNWTTDRGQIDPATAQTSQVQVRWSECGPAEITVTVTDSRGISQTVTRSIEVDDPIGDRCGGVGPLGAG